MAWWHILNGTFVNTVTVAVGSGIGLALGPRIPERYQRIILVCLGLMTIVLGVDAGAIQMGGVIERYGVGVEAYGARIAMVVVGCLLVGAILGTALRLHDRLDGLGGWIHRRMGGDASDGSAASWRFAEGFLTASVVFCVGPLTLLGCLRNGALGQPDLLYIKSFLDGFCSMALAATLGAGVLCSVVTVLMLQGGLAISAHYLAADTPTISLELMNVVGGLVLLATALVLLDIRKLPVADLMPAIVLPPLVVWVIERAAPGTLLLLAGGG